ncbi:glycosyltransferase family 2 protein [Jatrophihabitans endophyticus]|uniref:glycosyltransferase family 2 protein n=1 Tax=Jatrophihabitans endophyticus TaxID=1206085 RepID=UPI000A8829C7|nr:glycosyltransferase family 2 protein [Jatrophihabitans endophyticus]
MLPCLDEAGALPWVLERIPPGARAVVVDNGSTDGSVELARAADAFVIGCEQRGYGAACHAGLLAASAEYVAVCDCDASVDPGQAMVMLDVLRAGADLAVARRRSPRGTMPVHARVANLELARRVRRRTGAPLRDIGPLRVARRLSLLDLGLADRRSGYPVETVVRAADAGWTIVNVDVAYLPRTGRSKVTGTLRGTVQAVRDMSAVLAR